MNFKFGREFFTKYDERDLINILEPLDELKRSLKDCNIDIYEEAPVGRRTIQAILAGKRISKRDGEVRMSPRWEIFFRRLLDRETALLSEAKQSQIAIEKLFLSIYRLLENEPKRGLRLVEIAIVQAQKYNFKTHLIYLEKFKKIFLNRLDSSLKD